MLIDASLELIQAFLVRELLSSTAQEQFVKGKIAHSELAPYVNAIRELSESYTGHTPGKAISQPVSSSVSAEAYALYYLLINAAKVASLLREVSLKSTCRVLDFGCGPGTATLALLAATQSNMSVKCVEPSHFMRTLAARLIRAWPSGERLSSFEATERLGPNRDERYDLVIAANVLAEMGKSESEDLVDKLFESTAPDGYLVFIEPGQQLHTRRLMTIRDRATERFPSASIVFPCSRTTLCPMLQTSETDWCHGTIKWQRPALIRQFDELLAFNKHRLKYSAFIFQKIESSSPHYRVVSEPEKSRRGVTATVCGQEYYGPVTIRKSLRSERTRALEKAEVFDLLTFSDPPQAEVSEDTNVTCVF